MKCSIFSKKKSKALDYQSKAVDHSTRRIVAWVTGNRDAATFTRLYEKVKHLKNCTFYTDDWDAFSKVSTKKPP
ncbi:hypothetical protein P618_200576 [Holospora obtusa F1]|uniref:IS1 transposase n=1 Tax=Holospora obtusa F1 TaxID=1399147 RepID=W1N171_HOLOB|nr:IS1 transposase [Holospora obtusa]ETZ07182.1 hypothetical protein P618_200639 [Holospora obtusa F1]ETZ07242.1 hypothetical protein P618_200576 [Holospora obtusa F1]